MIDSLILNPSARRSDWCPGLRPRGYRSRPGLILKKRRWLQQLVANDRHVEEESGGHDGDSLSVGKGERQPFRATWQPTIVATCGLSLTRGARKGHHRNHHHKTAAKLPSLSSSIFYRSGFFLTKRQSRRTREASFLFHYFDVQFRFRFQGMGSIHVAADELDTDFDFLIACPTGVPRGRFSVDFSRRYDREPHPNEELESYIDTVWSVAVSGKSYLYNALKFRYGGHCVLEIETPPPSSSSSITEEAGVKEGGGEEKRGGGGGCRKGIPWRICLRLGLTDYKTFVGTQLSPRWRSFLCTGSENVGSALSHVAKFRHLAANLGNAAIVETADEKILVLGRGANVGHFPNCVVFPGGHSEPSAVGIDGHKEEDEEREGEGGGEGEREREGDESKLKKNEDIKREIFDGVTREVVEETGLPTSVLSDPLFLGIACRRVNASATSFFFLACSLTADRALEFYESAADRHESNSLRALSREELWLEGATMPGDHAGGTQLYKSMLKLTRGITFD